MFTEETFTEVEKIIRVPVEVIEQKINDVSIDVNSQVLDITETVITKNVEKEVIKIVEQKIIKPVT